jgi:hypothetical protein
MVESLAVDTPGGVTAHQSFDFCHTDTVEISNDRVLETTGCHGKLQGILLIRIGVQSIDQTGGKGISTADAIHDIADGILVAQVELLAVVQAGSPVIAVRILKAD